MLGSLRIFFYSHQETKPLTSLRAQLAMHVIQGLRKDDTGREVFKAKGRFMNRETGEEVPGLVMDPSGHNMGLSFRIFYSARNVNGNLRNFRVLL
jgi:hypothetical protein